MKFKINSKYVKWGITAFFVIAAAICFYYVVFHMTDIVRNVKSLSRVTTPIICGLIIAYLMTPILNSFEKGLLNPLFDKMKIKPSVKREKIIRALSILLTVVLVFFILYAIIAMLISQIVPSIRAIISNFDTYVDNVSAWLDKLLENNPDLKNYVVPQVSKASTELEKWLEDTATLLAKSSEILKTVSLSIISFVKATWNFIIGFIISIYVLASKETFSDQSKKNAICFVPDRCGKQYFKVLPFHPPHIHRLYQRQGFGLHHYRSALFYRHHHYEYPLCHFSKCNCRCYQCYSFLRSLPGSHSQCVADFDCRHYPSA